MKVFTAMIIAIGLSTAPAFAQQPNAECRNQTGLPIPCGVIKEGARGEHAENPKHMEFQEPIFKMENVAPDSPPEQVEMLNHPTWENAHKAAIARIYRNYKMFVATQMMMAVQKAIVSDVKKRTGLTDKDYMKILEVIVREHGLPTMDLEAAGIPPDPLLESATRALSGISGGR